MSSFAHSRTRSRVASGEDGSAAGPWTSRKRRTEGRRAGLLAAAGALSALLYATVANLGDLREEMAAFFGLYAVLFLVFAASLVLWWKVRSPRLLAGGIAFALLFRVLLLPATPTLSDDLHRYLWEGHVVRQGESPYRYAPADPALAPLRDAGWQEVAHRHVPSVYPPVAQAVFATAGFGGRLLRAVFLLLDVAVVLCLVFLLRRAGLPEGRAMVYGWCPLAVVEVAGSGHLEPLALVPALVAAALLLEGRGDGRVSSGLWLALAAGARLLHGSFVLCWARRLRARGLVAFGAALLLLWTPFLGGALAEEGPREPVLESSRGLGIYARSWEFNGPVFLLVRSGIEWLEPTEALKEGITALRERLGELPGLHRAYFYTDPPTLARGVVLVGFAGWAGILGARRTPPLRAGYLTTGAFLLLSPTVHPWYVLQIVPFLAFFPSLAWLVFTGTVALSYVAYLSITQQGVPLWALALEYLPLAGLLVLGARLPGRNP